MQQQRVLGWVLVSLLSLGAAACKEASAQELVRDEATLAERGAAGTLHWKVAEDGKVQLVVHDPAGKVLSQGVTGQLSFKSDGASPPPLALHQNEKSGVLQADGPDLAPTINEVNYALLINGKPETGVLHLPQHGTKGLVDASRAQAAAEEKGPHGGVVQVVGKQRYELVADSESSAVRVYPVSASAPRPKRLELAVDGDGPDRVVLNWHDEDYYVAELRVRRAPRKLTLLVTDEHDDVHVVLVGHRPGVVVLVDRHPIYWGRRGWARGHHHGELHGPPGKVRVRVHDGPHHVKVKHKGKKGVSVKVH